VFEPKASKALMACHWQKTGARVGPKRCAKEFTSACQGLLKFVAQGEEGNNRENKEETCTAAKGKSAISDKTAFNVVQQCSPRKKPPASVRLRVLPAEEKPETSRALML